MATEEEQQAELAGKLEQDLDTVMGVLEGTPPAVEAAAPTAQQEEAPDPLLEKFMNNAAAPTAQQPAKEQTPKQEAAPAPSTATPEEDQAFKDRYEKHALPLISKLQRENGSIREGNAALVAQVKVLSEQMQRQSELQMAQIKNVPKTPEQQEAELKAKLDAINADPDGYIAREVSKALAGSKAETLKEIEAKLKEFQPMLTANQREAKKAEIYSELAEQHEDMRDPEFVKLTQSEDVIRQSFKLLPKSLREQAAASIEATDDLFQNPLYHSIVYLVAKQKQAEQKSFETVKAQSATDQEAQLKLAKNENSQRGGGQRPAAPSNGNTPQTRESKFAGWLLDPAGGMTMERALAGNFKKA